MFDCRIAKNGFNLGGMFKFIALRNKDVLDNPDRFYQFGIILFCGLQGSGKSLSAFRLINSICNEKNDVAIISNVGLSFHDVVPYNGIQTVFDVTENQGDRGTILFLDEIANQFPSTISKEISDDWFTITNMMRKRRLLVIGTTPVFSRLVKPFREQFEYVCVCEQKFGGLIQNNYWYRCNVETTVLGDSDMENTHNMQVARHQWFLITPDDVQRYDTNEIVRVVKSRDRKERA